MKNSVQVIVRIVVSFLNVKIIAVLVGPGGMALVSQLNNSLQVGLSISSLGFKDGIVKYVSQHKGDKEAQKEYISTSIIAVVLMSAFMGFLTLLFSRTISQYLLHTEAYYLLFRFTGIYFISAALLNLTIAILNGLEKQGLFITVNIVLSVSGFLIALGAVLQWGMTGLLWAQIFNVLIAFAYAVFIYQRHIKIQIKNVSFKAIKKLSKYSAMTIFSAFAAPLVFVTIRNIIISQTSVEVAGLWDGINKISSNYILVITSAFSYYFIPTFSQLNTREGIISEVKKTYQLLIPLLTVGGLAIFISKDWIIKILFTEEFSAMRPFFKWQLIGDFFKVLAWVPAILLISKARIKTYITTEIIALALQLILIKIFTQILAQDDLTLYYGVENFLYFLMMMVIYYFYYVRKTKQSKL